jgi:hypothetical protein
MILYFLFVFVFTSWIGVLVVGRFSFGEELRGLRSRIEVVPTSAISNLWRMSLKNFTIV